MSRPSLCSLIERRAPLDVVAARLRDTRLIEWHNNFKWRIVQRMLLTGENATTALCQSQGIPKELIG